MPVSYQDHLRRLFHRVNKIDDVAVDGLTGTSNSLAYKMHEIEKHFHSLERWYGNDGDSTGSTTNNHTVWQLTAHADANTYGTEVLMLAANDVAAADHDVTPVYFDIHEVEIVAIDTVDKTYYVQLWTGTGAFGAATLRAEFPVNKAAVKAEPTPVTIMCPRIAVAEKVWGRCKCETGSATIDILLGIHAYAG
jgi:hypothetical protein